MKFKVCMIVFSAQACSVEKFTLKVIECSYQGGKVLIMRCGSWPELQDWRKALESAAKTKVKRQHFELVQEKVRHI